MTSDDKQMDAVTTATALLPMPADGEEFELTLDFDAPEDQPLALVKRFECSGNWKNNGTTKENGKQTRRFKWMAVGTQKNLDGVKTALKSERIPEGVWLSAIIAKYTNNGVPRGIADSSWEIGHNASFPCVHSDGEPNVYWAGHCLYENWRWLVEVK